MLSCNPRFMRWVQGHARRTYPRNLSEQASPPTDQPSFRSVMVFGSSTGVGKTVISAGLCRAALQESHRQVCYIKPVQTGELDEYFIQLYANPTGVKDLFTRTLFHWLPAMSPHLAAQQSKDQGGAGPCTDSELLQTLNREIRAFSLSSPSTSSRSASSAPSSTKFAVVETAGGVLSPAPSMTLQADLYRSLRLPIVLVADAKLGGITTTLTAFESLRLRGYTVHAIVMIAVPDSDMFGNNLDTVQSHITRSLASSNAYALNAPAPKVFSLSPLPDQQMLHGWYKENEATFSNLYRHVDQSVTHEWERLALMASEGSRVVWWPFTQHGNVDQNDVTVIESAHGDRFRVLDTQNHPKPQSQSSSDSAALTPASATRDLFDACASWWTQGVGHGNPNMSLAIAEAAGRYGHVMFPSNLHPPAVQLARYMVSPQGPGRRWASRVFFSDDGSTAMEIAIKMALRLSETRKGIKSDANPCVSKVMVLSQQDCYHGDTLGAMNTSEASLYNIGQHPWYKPLTLSMPLPLVAYRQGILAVDATSVGAAKFVVFPSTASVMDVASRQGSALEGTYRSFVQKFLQQNQGQNIGALLLEPVLVGAGGMKFVDPLYQKVLVQEARAHGIPVIFDEVAVGMWRLGPITTAEILKEVPDIAAYGKMISGGYLPLALTLASNETFECFLGHTHSQALLHGHSYTANPLGCAAALEAIRLFEKCDNICPTTGGMMNSFYDEEILELSKLPGVQGAMGLGSVLAVTLGPSQNASTASAPSSTGHSGIKTAAIVVELMRNNGIYARPLANVVYGMPTPMSSDADKRRLIRVLIRCITKAFYAVPKANAKFSESEGTVV